MSVPHARSPRRAGRVHGPVVACLVLLLAGCGSTTSGLPGGGLASGDVSMHLLRSQGREAQRVIADLQAQLDESRQTLAASQMARARLQGQARELERRYDEAHQVVELQREELARLREEREEVLRTSRQLQAQMTRLQRQLTALGQGRSRRVNGAGAKVAVEVGKAGGMVALPVTRAGVADPLLNGVGGAGGGLGIVVVRRGDSLWKIAKRHGVSYPALRTLNGLDDNPDLIYPGQELILPR